MCTMQSIKFKWLQYVHDVCCQPNTSSRKRKRQLREYWCCQNLVAVVNFCFSFCVWYPSFLFSWPHHRFFTIHYSYLVQLHTSAEYRFCASIFLTYASAWLSVIDPFSWTTLSTMLCTSRAMFLASLNAKAETESYQIILYHIKILYHIQQLKFTSMQHYLLNCATVPMNFNENKINLWQGTLWIMNMEINF
jgi:hypothetical protein